MENKVSNRASTGSHSFSLKDRKTLEMDGVQEVISFNEDRVILQTNQGNLDIKGRELNIQKLNLDNSSIKLEGYIFSLEYNDKKTKKGIINRLFK
jgi:sporulation protein YabP